MTAVDAERPTTRSKKCTPEQICELVEANLPLVRHVLAGVTAHYPRHADRDELGQAAALGLVEAAHRYDPERGVPFERWASLRIRGAIVDAVRGIDFAPRALRAAGRELETATVALQNQRGRTPTTSELAAQLGVSTHDVVRLQGRIHGSLVVSLDAPTGDEGYGGGTSLASSLVDTVAVNPAELLEERERASYLRDAVELLPERLREVISGYFLHGETSGELAARLGVSESRVSQMRSEALRLMRVGLQAQFTDAPAVSTTVGTAAVTSRESTRQAAYALALGTHSSFRARMSVPRQRAAESQTSSGLRALA